MDDYLIVVALVREPSPDSSLFASYLDRRYLQLYRFHIWPVEKKSPIYDVLKSTQPRTLVELVSISSN